MNIATMVLPGLFLPKLWQGNGTFLEESSLMIQCAKYFSRPHNYIRCKNTNTSEDW